jgi:hypothetical protein
MGIRDKKLSGCLLLRFRAPLQSTLIHDDDFFVEELSFLDLSALMIADPHH